MGKNWLGSITDLLSGENAVGLSIGTSSIKLVELKKAGKGWKLLHFGVVQLPDEVINNREISNTVAVVDSIRSLVTQLRLKTKSVCISLSGPAVIVKKFQVEVPNKKDLQDSVFWEAEQYLPFDVSEVVMDFQVISGAKEARTEVLLVAVKRSVLDSYMACVQDAGLKCKVADIDYFALAHVFEANYPANPSEAVAVVDIGAAAMKMSVLQSGVPIFTKDSALGGRTATQEIQKALGIPYADAEALKTGTQGMPQEVSELLGVMAENTASEIKRALDFYNASSIGAPVSSVLLCGGGSKIANLSRIVEDKLGLPTQMLNPFNGVSYDPAVFSPDYLASIGPVAAVPIGLAIRAGTR